MVGKLIKQGLPVQGGGGKGVALTIDTGEAITWLVAKGGKSEEQATSQPGETPNLTAERLRLTSAQADRSEFDLLVDQGRYVLKEDVKRMFAEVCVIAASQLEGLPGRLCLEIASMDSPAEIQDLVKKEMRRIRTSFADKLQAWIREG